MASSRPIWDPEYTSLAADFTQFEMAVILGDGSSGIYKLIEDFSGQHLASEFEQIQGGYVNPQAHTAGRNRAIPLSWTMVHSSYRDLLNRLGSGGGQAQFKIETTIRENGQVYVDVYEGVRLNDLEPALSAGTAVTCKVSATALVCRPGNRSMYTQDGTAALSISITANVALYT